MTADAQGAFDFSPDWLGLNTDNRRLFDVLQDGWFRPSAARTGVPFGIDTFVREGGEPAGNRIPVRVRIDAAKLPNMEVSVFREDQWRPMLLAEVAPDDRLLYWPGALPAFAIRDIAVPSREHLVRLRSMAQRASNVEVPDVLVSDVEEYSNQETPLPSVMPPETPPGLVIPAKEDAIRGALTMAVWAVPKIDPWMDLLVTSLSEDSKRLKAAAAEVEAEWWQFPPWMPIDETKPNDVQTGLWLAAIEVFRSCVCLRPADSVDEIARLALRGICSSDRDAVENWRRATHGVLRTEAQIQHDSWRQDPVGLAIQLLLTRPEPLAFRTWLTDGHVCLAPAVAWSAATLCGLFHGYRKLDTCFRGEAPQREVMTIQALQMCSDASRVNWPRVTDGLAKWRRESGNFILTWGGRDVACKREKARGQWYSSDLDDLAVQREAVAVAKNLSWPCLTRVVSLGKGRRSLSGPGTAEASEETIRVRGNVRLHLLQDDRVEEGIDARSFRRSVAVEPGQLPPPTATTLGQAGEPADAVPGLRLIPNFLTEAEEEEILAKIDHSDWSQELQRRVQHYGWRYDYKSRQIEPTMRIGPLPAWAAALAQRLVDFDYVRELPDQLIVNEYVGNQGIAPHVDSKSSFSDGVAMISLLETWEMEFRKRNRKDKVNRRLERRGVAILEGPARYEWKHGIPKRKGEPGTLRTDNKKPRRVPRGRRLSLTFRKVVGPAVRQ